MSRSRRNSSIPRDMYPREHEIEILSSKTLNIYQQLGGDVNTVVWDAAIVLAKYLEMICQSRENFLKGQKVLELGAGLGLVGLTAACLGAHSILTDLPDAIPLLKFNINENKNNVMCLGGYAVAETLQWGDTTSDILQNMTFDYVLFSDCVYYEESIDPLLATLQNINSSSIVRPKIIMSQELRQTEMQKQHWTEFYKKLTENFHIKKIPEKEQHPEFKSYDILLMEISKIT